FSRRRRHTRSKRDWSSDVCSSDLQTVLYYGNSYNIKPSSIIKFCPVRNLLISLSRYKRVPFRSCESNMPLLPQRFLYCCKNLSGCLSRIPPGLIALTRMLSFLNILAKYFVMPISPCLATVYSIGECISVP